MLAVYITDFSFSNIVVDRECDIELCVIILSAQVSLVLPSASITKRQKINCSSVNNF